MDQQIPERVLSDRARARCRAELMEAIGDEALASRPWLAPIAAAAAMAVFGGALFVASGLNDAGPDPGRPAGGIEGWPSDCVQLQDGAWVGVAAVPRGLLMPTLGQGIHVLRSFRDLVTDHRDTRGRQLLSVPSSVQGPTPQLASCHLSRTVGWTFAGENGEGRVRVEVDTSWEESHVRLTHDGWRSVSTDLPGVEEAFVVDYDGGMAVAAIRTDGLMVAIDATQVDDPRLGNDSSTGSSPSDLEIDELLAIVADARLSLP